MAKHKKRRKNRFASFLYGFGIGLVIVGLSYGVYIFRYDLLRLATDTYENLTGKEAPWDASEIAANLSNSSLQDVTLSPEDVVIEDVPRVSDGRYAFSTLSESEKLVYDQVYDAIMNYKEDVAISTLDKEVLSKVYNCVVADYGGLFWVHGYSYHTYAVNDEVINLTFTPDFTMTEAERDAYQAEVDAVVADWLSGISLEATDYEKSKFVFETLISKADYVKESENNQNILSVFLNQETVCQGYADATSYLLEELGVQSTVVTGVANDETHAWNLVYLDGQYYYMDTTWGNSKFLEPDQTMSKSINYIYLNADSATINRTHSAYETFPLPECVALEDNYYVQEGLYFTAYDINAIGGRIAELYYAGQSIVSIRFENPSDYESTIRSLITDGNIRNFIRVERFTYIQQDDDYILTLRF